MGRYHEPSKVRHISDNRTYIYFSMVLVISMILFFNSPCLYSSKSMRFHNLFTWKGSPVDSVCSDSIVPTQQYLRLKLNLWKTRSYKSLIWSIFCENNISCQTLLYLRVSVAEYFSCLHQCKLRRMVKQTELNQKSILLILYPPHTHTAYTG